MFGEYIEYYYIVPISTFIIAAMMIAVNYWDATALENKLLTNFKKLQILGSTLFIESIFLSFVLYVLVFMKEGLPEAYKVKGSVTASLIPFVFNLLVVSLILSILINFIMFLCKKLFMVKYFYSVKLGDSGKKWFLVRKSNKNQILLNDNEGGHIFLGEWNELVFQQELAPYSNLQRFLYSNEKRFKKITSTLVLSTITLYVFSFVVDLSDRDSLLLQIIILLLMGASISLIIIGKLIFKVRRNM